MHQRHLVLALLLAVLTTLGVGITLTKLQESTPQESTPQEETANASKFEIALIGDIPYNANEQRETDVLIGELNSEKLAFVVHVGDIKNSGEPCTDEVYFREKKRFESSKHPFIYTPGDNEWTDCHLSGYKPVERLERLRQIFFTNDESLGERKISLTRQSAQYPENVRWSYGDAIFIGLNMPGGNNHRGRAPGEYAARNEANLEWMREGFDRAEADGSSAVMIAIQADPGFERPPEERTGYNDFLTTLERETLAFGKPVVLVHGDSHTFTVDKPMISSETGERVENFTRVQVFADPARWIRGSVDTSEPKVFTFEPENVEESP